MPACFPISTRWMLDRDMDQVLAIERANYAVPWTQSHFQMCRRERPYEVVVATSRGDQQVLVLGYVVYQRHQRRMVVVNIAVATECHRRSVGAQLIQRLQSKLSAARRNRLMLYVRETNLPAQLFFRRMGFQAVRVVRDHYEDTGESAYKMVYRIPREVVAHAGNGPAEAARIDPLQVGIDRDSR